MQPAEIQQKLTARFGDRITGANLQALDPWIEVAPAAIADVCRYCRDDAELQCDTINDLCAVDYFDADPKKMAKGGYEPHVEVVYHLYSYPLRHGIVLKVKTPRWKDGKAGSLPEVPSCAGVWSICDWHEREAYDLVGIRFTGHPNLRRILCPEDWEGHPLRKDYDLPLEYHGIRGK